MHSRFSVDPYPVSVGFVEKGVSITLNLLGGSREKRKNRPCTVGEGAWHFQRGVVVSGYW